MDINTFMKACSVSTSMATRWCDPVSAAMALYDISTPAEQAAFVAQVGHESASFVFTTELWGPTPTQLTYEPPSAKATDLGNTQKGDGSLFRGRGLIQITGRYNYQQVSNALGNDYISNPTQLAQVSDAALSAAWFWNMKGLNLFCTGDPTDFITMTARINGGTNGLADRQARWTTAKFALGA